MIFKKNQKTNTISPKEKEKLTEALRSLGAEDEKKRLDAINNIVKAGETAIPYLLGIIQDGDMENTWMRSKEGLDIQHAAFLNSPEYRQASWESRKSTDDLFINNINKLRYQIELSRTRRYNALIALSRLFIPEYAVSDTIQTLIGALSVDFSEAYPKVSKTAAEILKAYGSVTIPYLVNAWGSSDASLKNQIIRVLTSMEINSLEKSTPFFLVLLNDADHSDIAITILSQMKGPAREAIIRELIDQLNTGSESEKANAAKALGAMKSDAAIALPDLEKALDEKNPEVKSEVLRSIGNIGNTNPELASKLFDLWKQSGTLELMETLCKIKHPKMVGIILETAFNSPQKAYPDDFDRCLKYYTNAWLTKEMIEWALEASCIDGYLDGKLWGSPDDKIQKLCDIKTPITSNILHLIAKKKDTYDYGYHDSDLNGIMSFKDQREKAQKELKARGNPRYDPSCFTSY